MKKFLMVLTAAAFVMTAGAAWASPYAFEVYSSSGPFGNSPYNDPLAVLGKPTTMALNAGWPSSDPFRIKLVEPAYNVDLDGNKLITTLNYTSSTQTSSHITVKFDHQVMDDPNNPYGQDFLVFGNGFYAGTGGFVSDSTDMSAFMLGGYGGGFWEPVLISVSQGPAYEGQPESEWNWYTYQDGPYGDTQFPTHAFHWDQDQYDLTGMGWTDEEMDFTLPVNPEVEQWYQAVLDAGGLVSSAQMIEWYGNSGGGTGFDLAESGFEWIQYIRAEGTFGFAGGEIDAFSDVAPVPIPAAFWLLGSGLLGMLGIRRRVAS